MDKNKCPIYQILPESQLDTVQEQHLKYQEVFHIGTRRRKQPKDKHHKQRYKKFGFNTRKMGRMDD